MPSRRQALVHEGAKRIKTPIGKARSVSGRARGLIAGRTPHDPARGGDFKGAMASGA
jgi:hypothetical protein